MRTEQYTMSLRFLALRIGIRCPYGYQLVLSIRMLSIDTPEVHYPGNADPSKHDDKLKQLADWLAAGKAPADPDLAQYLQPKLATGTAGTLQKTQGETAKQEFQKLLDQKLSKPSGGKRNLFLRAANEHFDQYGRLLAYVSPCYTAEEISAMSYEDRATFNFLLVKSGWAATFPIYPSLPKYKDLVLIQKAAEDAFAGKLGAWQDDKALTGYEFRMCYKLWEVTQKLVAGKKLTSKEKYGWIERYCADMTSLEVHEPQQYQKVLPYNRVFIWPRDLNDAIGKLNLTPAG